MRTLTLFAALALAASPAAAKPKTFQVEGKKITADVEPLKPEVEVSESATSKEPAVTAYLNYMRALANGDIDAAAALTQAPEKTKAQQQAYRDRLGGIDALKERYVSALTSHLKLTHIINARGVTMLVGQHPEQGAFANFVVCTKGKCLVSNDAESPAVADLASLISGIRDGNVKL